MNSVSYPCPNCGQPYALDADYLARYGGHDTQCSRCKKMFTLPTSAAIGMAAPGSDDASYAVAAASVPAANVAQPAGPGGASMLPYASISPSVEHGGVWREKRNVIAAAGAVLPNYCIKCGQPATGKPFKRVYYWHDPALYLLILIGLIIYAIVAVCVQKKATVTANLCDVHRGVRRRNILIGWLIALSSIGLWFLAGTVGNRNSGPLLVVGGILVLIAGLIVAIMSGRLFRPLKIRDGFIWLSGAKEPFLQMLPSAR